MVALKEPRLPAPSFTGSPAVAGHLKRASAFNRAGDVPSALREYDAALEILPDDPNLRRTRGMLLGELERWQEAEAELRRAFDSSPGDATLLVMVAIALYKMQRFEAALETCDQALNLSPRNPDAQALRGFVLDALGQLEEAMEAFDRALAIKHSDNVASARKDVLLGILRRLARSGFASWSGGKPKGSDPPIPITPGPPVSDLVHQMRR